MLFLFTAFTGFVFLEQAIKVNKVMKTTTNCFIDFFEVYFPNFMPIIFMEFLIKRLFSHKQPL